MKVAITGFAMGSRVSLSVTQGVEIRSTIVEAWGVEPPPPSNAPKLATEMWTLSDEGSAATDGIARLEFLDIPVHDGWQADSFICQVDDGNGWVENFIHWGATLNKTRRIALTIGVTHDVRVAIRWRKLNTALADLFDYEQSDWSDIKSVTPSAVAQPTVTIVPQRTDQRSAPTSSMYEVDIRGFGVIRPNHDLLIQWNYGDTGSTHKRLRQGFMDVHGNDANTSTDFIGVHTFENPGPHMVTCTVQSSDLSASGTYNEIVRDPDVTFAGVKTCYIRTDGDFSDLTSEIADGANTATSFVGAKAFYNKNDSVRFLVRRGDDHSNGINDLTINYADFHVGLYGPENGITRFPALSLELPNSQTLTQGDRCIWGGEIIGPYDPSNPGTVSTRPYGINLLSDGVTLHDLKISGWDICTNMTYQRFVVFSSVHMTDWSNYGVYNSEGKMHAFVGCTMAQNPLTIRADGKAENGPPIYADHGPYRCSIPSEPVAFSKCDLFSVNTWIGASKTVQLCARWNAGNIPGMAFMFAQCMTEGSTLQVGGTTTPNQSSPVDAVVSKVHHTSILGGALATNASGVSFYNNVVIFRGGAPEGDDLKSGFTVGQSYSSSNYNKEFPNLFNASDNPIRFRNNTVIDLRTSEETKKADGSGDVRPFVRLTNSINNNLPSEVQFADVEDSNNAFHAPLLVSGVDDGPFDLTSLGSGWYQGRVFLGENGETLQPQFANAGTLILPVPQQGAAALTGYDVSKSVLDDFNGNLRMSSNVRGALKQLS